MRIADMNWMQVEEYLKRDDRAVLPIGSIEQHAYLSLATDAILAERIAVEAAEPLGVPVFPALAYGITPGFRAFPGTISLRVETMIALVRDALDGLASHGFRRILVVNGHGGNQPIAGFCGEWRADHPGVRVRLVDWWSAPEVWRVVEEIDPRAGHASWMENFAWTRIAGVTPPAEPKPVLDPRTLQGLDPATVRARVGDGNYGGPYRREDAEMERIWATAVAEIRELIERGWA